MEISGRLKVIEDTQSFGANGFRKREVVVTTDEQYPQHILIEFTQDKCDLLNNYRIGEPVKVGINLRGREWLTPQGETKYFNSIQGWRIEKEGQQQATNNVPTTKDSFKPTANYREEEHDDLPF